MFYTVIKDTNISINMKKSTFSGHTNALGLNQPHLDGMCTQNKQGDAKGVPNALFSCVERDANVNTDGPKLKKMPVRVYWKLSKRK